MTKALAGFWPILRLNARLEVSRLPFWILAVAFIPLSSIPAYEVLFPTAEQQAAANATLGTNPALLLLFGPAPDLSTAGGFTAWRSAVFSGVFVSLMAIFTVIRRTRAEEDSGRAELVSSARVGRYTYLTAAVTLATAASLVAGIVIAAGLTALDAGAAGSVALGMSVALTGFAFAGVAAIAAQLGSFARTATSLAVTALGVSYVLRAWGDTSESMSWLSWVSPLGWTVKVQAFTENNVAPMVLLAGSAVIALGIGYALLGRRDLGLGILTPREGPAHASARLSNGLGLASRLQASTLVAWAIGLTIVGVVFGSVSSSIGEVLSGTAGDSGFADAFGGGGSPGADVSTLFISTLVTLLAILAASYGVSAALRARMEESEGRVEPLLATGLSRVRWLGGHLVFALGGSALLVLASGTALGVSAAASGVDTQVVDVFGAAVVQIAALWVLVGLAAALVGAAPRFATLAWIAVAVTFLLTVFGPLLDVPETVLGISPFYHLPTLPGGEFDVAPVLALSALAGALIAAGFVGIRRRDIG